MPLTAHLANSAALVSPLLRFEPQYEGPHPQRASTGLPHAEGDELSGVIRDGEVNAFISGPAAFVGGVPLTRAMNPWAMPEASL